MQEAAPGRIAHSAGEISDCIAGIARSIDADYEGKDLVLVCVLKGSLYFFADLTRAIRIPIRLDFIAISGFSPTDPASGAVRIVKDLDLDITGKHVLLVEDIVRTGLTTAYLVQTLETRKPASIRVCSLLVNHSQLMINVPIAYQGFEVTTKRLIGYGMDIGEHGRNLPDISEVERQSAL